MDDQKVGVAVFVKTKMKVDDGWRDSHAFGGHFDNLAESIGYLKFLEGKDTEYYVQIGWVGWRKD